MSSGEVTEFFYKYDNWASFPMDVGIDPVMWFFSKEKLWRFFALPISLGIVPFNEL